jgi:hypothetical protein
MGNLVIGHILELGGMTKHNGATLISWLGGNLQHQMEILFFQTLVMMFYGHWIY